MKYDYNFKPIKKKKWDYFKIITAITQIVTTTCAIVALFWINAAQLELSKKNNEISEQNQKINNENLPLKYELQSAEIDDVVTKITAKMGNHTWDSVTLGSDVKVSGNLTFKYKVTQGTADSVFLLPVIEKNEPISIKDFVYCYDHKKIVLDFVEENNSKIKKIPTFIVAIGNDGSIYIDYFIFFVETNIIQSDDESLEEVVLSYNITKKDILRISEQEAYSPQLISAQFDFFKNEYKKSYIPSEVDELFEKEINELSNKFKEVRKAYESRYI